MSDEYRFLKMDDGVQIAVTLHLPDDTPPPWPIVYEARPYRKDDVSDATAIYRRLCDEGGLAVCRADVRGTGSSEGIADDEYTSRELEDHVATIAWLAEQEWSNGSVGMFGTSYSGFNSLQVAALRPPALKAIIPIYATDRRFTDDVHYGGGAMRGIDFLDYPTLMLAMNALPPVPSVYGDGWRDEWLRRIDATEPWFLPWLEHQREDDYWRHGSVFFDGYEAIEAATMIVAGHADGYHNMAFRGFERLRGPKKLLFGPWSHMSPRFSMPGPRIDHVPEMIRWWHRWLRGDDNGVEHDPPIQIFVRRSTAPRADLDAYEGKWRSEVEWPPARMREERRAFDGARIRDGDPNATNDTVQIRGDVGVTGSIWCAADLPFGEPWDQRPDEAFSLVYDWPAVKTPLEIMGHPRVELTVTSSAPVAFVSAKLCDVFPDGSSALVTRAILNLTHRNGFGDPEPLTPGEPVTVSIELGATSWVWEPDHRVRLDLAGSDFPSTWPPPYAGTLTVDRTGSALVLPVLDGPPVADPPVFAPGVREAHRVEGVSWTTAEDVLARVRTVAIDHGGVRGAGARELEYYDRYGGEIVASIDEPGNARATGGTVYELSWPDVRVRTASRATLRSDSTTWYLELELDVQENGETIATRRWERTLPRDLA